MVCACILPAGTLHGFPCTGAQEHCVSSCACWCLLGGHGSFYPKQIKSQQHPFGLAKIPGSSSRESSTICLQVRGLVLGSGQAVRSRERQRALLGAPCAGQGEEQPHRAIAVSHGAEPCIPGSSHRQVAELFRPVPSCLGRWLMAPGLDCNRYQGAHRHSPGTGTEQLSREARGGHGAAGHQRGL